MLEIKAGGFTFLARYEEEAAPATVAAFRDKLLPLDSKIIHVRWSGQAGWIPMGDLDLGISLCPLTLPMVRSTRLMVENLAVVLPSEHVLAGRSSVSMAELDGETFLLFRDIGFWRQVCDQNLPHSEFIVQEDRGVFEGLVRSSPLPHFITDAPSFSDAAPDRVIVPIRDTAAHATFHLLARAGCRQEAENLFDWVSRQ